MWRSLRTVICCALLYIGVSVTASNASENRTTFFAFNCDGNQQNINFTVSGLGAASTRFIQGSSITLFQRDGTLRYILVYAINDPNRLVASISMTEPRAARDFTGFYSVPNNLGTMSFLINGLCTGGGQVQGVVTIDFFS